MYAALHTSTSTGPCSRSTAANAVRTASGSAMSATTGKPPVSSTTSRICGVSARPFTPTFAPSAASRSAIARPIPWVAPVTTATRPSW